MKIALCLSGESRMFNEFNDASLERGPQEFYRKLQQYNPDWTVDVYGHTWTHCELPVTDVFQFKQLIIEDQKLIDDWVKEDFLNRAFSNKIDFNPKYKLSEMSLSAWVDKLLDRSRWAYGQHFSAYHCFALLPKNEYDIVIRYRWDLSFEPRFIPDGNELGSWGATSSIDFFKKSIGKSIENLISPKHYGIEPAAIITNNMYVHGGQPNGIQMDDTFFMFNRKAFAVINKGQHGQDTTFEDHLAHVFSQTHENEKHSAHSLWGDLLFSHRHNTYGLIIFHPDIPNTMLLHRNTKNNIYINPYEK